MGGQDLGATAMAVLDKCPSEARGLRRSPLTQDLEGRVAICSSGPDFTKDQRSAPSSSLRGNLKLNLVGP